MDMQDRRLRPQFVASMYGQSSRTLNPKPRNISKLGVQGLGLGFKNPGDGIQGQGLGLRVECMWLLPSTLAVNPAPVAQTQKSRSLERYPMLTTQRTNPEHETPQDNTCSSSRQG